RPIDIRSSRAPRACSSSNARLRAGRPADGWTCRHCQHRCAWMTARSTMNRREKPQALSIRLPQADRTLKMFFLSEPRDYPARAGAPLHRSPFAVVRVGADPLATAAPCPGGAIDWDRTLAFREPIGDLGLGVAEAMDPAKRGMGVDWPTSPELIRR